MEEEEAADLRTTVARRDVAGAARARRARGEARARDGGGDGDGDDARDANIVRAGVAAAAACDGGRATRRGVRRSTDDTDARLAPSATSGSSGARNFAYSYSMVF